MQIQVTRSTELQAGYVELNGNTVRRSEELTEDVIVDLDEFGCVVGVEFLDLDRVPLAKEIADKFHVTTSDRPMLELALQHLMRWKATSGSLTHKSQVQARDQNGRTLEAC